MFGFARSRHLALTPQEIRAESAYYCGLCHALRQDYGVWAAALTNFEGRFLALLVNAQSATAGHLEQTRCPLPPFPAHKVAPYGLATRFAAAATFYLVQQKLEDDCEDANSRVARLLLRLGERKWAQAEDHLRSVAFPFSELGDCRRVQHKVESAVGSISLQQVLEPSAQAMSSIFAFTSDLAHALGNRDVLSQVGAQVGRLVCLLDACQDYRSDRRHGRFNPILRSCGTEGQLSLTAFGQVVHAIAESLDCIQSKVQQLNLHRFRRLVENTLTLGIAQQAKRILRLMPYQLRWSKPDITLAHQFLSLLPDTDVYDPAWQCRVAPSSPWKIWLMKQEIKLRTGRWADLLQPVWTSFRLDCEPDLSQGLLSGSNLVLGSMFLSFPWLLAQQDGCEEVCGEGCGMLGCCGYGAVEGVASCLSISPGWVLCCCCILGAAAYGKSCEDS